MADNTTRSATSGGDVIRDIDRSGVKTQVVALDVGGSTGERFPYNRVVDGGSTYAMGVDQRPKVTRITVTPTISVSPAYSLKDCLGSYMTFSNAARASGGSGRVQRVQIVDQAALALDLDLLLFDRSISGTTTATDNSVFDLTDADAFKLVGVIPVGGGYYSQFNDNAVADIPADLPFVLSGTADLTGLLIIRSVGTFVATTDIVVSLHIAQD